MKGTARLTLYLDVELQDAAAAITADQMKEIIENDFVELCEPLINRRDAWAAVTGVECVSATVTRL